VAGVACALAARLYVRLGHGLQHTFARLIPYAPLRPALGAVTLILLTYTLGTRDYLGLGVQAPPGGQVSILASFQSGGATPLSWVWKSLSTTVTLASGMKGGEVTPLFFIGSTLGNSLGTLLHEPVALFAALGFIAVFAGAAKTPLACTVMGMELFGMGYTLHYALVCYLAYSCSGKLGIYPAQLEATASNPRKMNA
jgi:H+/Cl- antiporter ClcA